MIPRRQKAVAAILAVVFAASPALAHGPGTEHVGPATVMSSWTIEPLPLVAILVAGAAYFLGARRLKPRQRPPAVPFYLGLLALALALVSPLETVSGTLLSAHMIQHMMLVAVAPVLLVAGRPDVVIMRSLGPRSRRFFRRPASVASLAVPAALVHAAVLWIWHAPALFEAALHSQLVHDLEHFSFVASALLFWHAVRAAGRAPSRRVAAATALVVTMIAGGFLGALLALSPRPLYAGYADGGLLWGFTPLADQQLAGLLMWVPTMGVYLVAGLLIGVAMLGPATRPAYAGPKVSQASTPKPLPRSGTATTGS